MAPVQKAAKLASTTSSSSIVSVVDKTLVKRLNDNESNPQGSYVLYWVQAAPRVECNPALEYASERANHFKVPLVACFGVTQSFPGANARHYHFMLEGLADFKVILQLLIFIDKFNATVMSYTLGITGNCETNAIICGAERSG